MAEPRSFAERKTHALAVLAEDGTDVWVATASTDGRAHLVPLSFGWSDGRVVLATEARSVTARNLAANGAARLGFGGTRDVLMGDAEVTASYPLAAAPPELMDVFARQSGWDPRGDSNAADYVALELRFVRLQAWREANEIAGRTLLRDGRWLDE
jgi:hypothetical protein